jgi:phosphopentomutase
VLDGGEPRDVGLRETFADVAATLADYFEIPQWHAGTSFLSRVAA